LSIITSIKATLLRNGYVREANKKHKLKKFYGKGNGSGKHSKTILFWSTGGMIIQSNIEAAIACALKLRGHNVKMVLCDGVYKACAKRVDFPDVGIDDWGKFCKSCVSQNSKLFERLGLEYTYIGELVSADTTERLKAAANKIDMTNFKELHLDGIHLGSHLESSMMRHTKGGSFEGIERIMKEYAFTILMNAEASIEAIKRFQPSSMYMSHGIYADWGPALSVSLMKDIPVTSYLCCYLPTHFFFGTVKTFSETFLSMHEPTWNLYKDSSLNEVQKLRLQHFLERRYKNNIARDMIGLLKEYKGNTDTLYEKYGLKKEKPIWGLMTHINWDAASDYFPMIYKNFDEWLYETVKEIVNIKDVQWLIKIHPSELNDNPDTGCQKFLEKYFPELPDHVKILKMDDDISPLDFYDLLDGGVTVMGTGGLELSVHGKPVILAGGAHYSNKGFTHDAKSDEHYKQLLKSAGNLKRLDEEKHRLALNYAYIYFIKKQIPVLPTVNEELKIDFEKLDFLVPGKNLFMDFICDRIVNGGDFVLPDNLVELTHVEQRDQIRNYA